MLLGRRNDFVEACTVVVDQSNKVDPSTFISDWIDPQANSDDLILSNISDRCTAQCGDCPDHHILWKVLRWIKLIAMRISRDYYTRTAVLITFPLLIGLVMGFMLARWSEKRRVRETKPQILIRETWWVRIASMFTLPIVMIWSGSWFEQQEKYSTLKSSIPRTPSIHTHHDTTVIPSNQTETQETLRDKEERARQDLRSIRGTQRESGVPLNQIPKHVAIIMDGNRRYGKTTYGNASAGHWDGSRKVLECAKWCIAEGIQVLTIYAFSTENWKRDPAEVASLMNIFAKYCEELREEAIQRNIQVRVLSTDIAPIPAYVKQGLQRLQHDTAICSGVLRMNICLSYGSRGEIVRACQTLARDCLETALSPEEITEEHLCSRLLTRDCPDPDILIRTSGEIRISNFLLWQLAYTEFFFLNKNWPELEKDDLLNIIRTFANGRSRRFGK